MLIPAIFQAIHESVPIPDGPLGTATTPAEVRAAIAAGAPPREERRQLFIDELNMGFEPDLHAMYR